MKSIHSALKLTIFSIITSIFINTLAILSPTPNPSAADCSLFNSTDPRLYQVPINYEYPCHGIHEKIDDGSNFPKTLCCRNRLEIWSQSMALYARRKQGNLLASEDLLETCFHPTVLLNISCGIEDIFYGSSQCSKLSLATVKEEKSYQIALGKCSSTSFVSGTFQEACANCTSAILDLRKTLLDRSGVEDKKNSTERSICAVAAVISVAAGQSDEIGGLAMIDSFYRFCLPALDLVEADKHDDYFIKIHYYVAKAVLAILIAIGILLFIIVVKNVTKKKPFKPAKSQVITAWSGLYRFSKAEIEYAMEFDDHHGEVFLGRGSAGNIYKGILPSGQAVAIKHITKSNDYVDSFKNEVKVLSRIRHQNLVSLVGFCVEDGEQYLVYEFCPAGNLAQHLLRKDTVLTWEIRVKILRDCALALKYLHHYLDGCIVHRDIKLTNILLTEKMEPKLSGFCLAKMLGIEETQVFTDVRGTFGYMDPEYMSNAKLLMACASDIYSFGIVALQLLSGQKAVELDLDTRDQLTRKAKDVNMGNRPVSDFEDQTLKGNFNKADFQSILQVAVLCVSNTSIGRPNIDVVFDEMDKIWKNIVKAMQGMSSSAMSVSRSLEMISV